MKSLDKSRSYINLNNNIEFDTSQDHYENTDLSNNNNFNNFLNLDKFNEIDLEFKRKVSFDFSNLGVNEI